MAFVHIDDAKECKAAVEELRKDPKGHLAHAKPPTLQQDVLTAAKYACEDPASCEPYTNGMDSKTIELMCSDEPLSLIIDSSKKTTRMKDECKMTCDTCVSPADRPLRPRGCVLMTKTNTVELFTIEGPMKWNNSMEYTAICKANPCGSDSIPTFATSREDSSGCTLSRGARQKREDALYEEFYIAALSILLLVEICGAIYLVIWLNDISRKDILLVLIFGIRTFDTTSDWGMFTTTATQHYGVTQPAIA